MIKFKFNISVQAKFYPILWLLQIDDFKEQDMLEEKTKQNENNKDNIKQTKTMWFMVKVFQVKWSINMRHVVHSVVQFGLCHHNGL